VRPSHLRGASGYLLVVDGCRADTLEKAVSLRQRASETVGEVPFILAVNKADIRDKWQIETSALDALTAQGWRLVYTSAKTGDGVETMFHDLAKAMVKESDARAYSANGGDRQA
jgi:50S ribosomal subunit-associated GTPase HflX